MSVSPTIVVLAGGLASRLGELTKSVPKSLLEVYGRPFLAWQLELFAAHGLRDVVLCVGHHADQMEAWVAANPVEGMTVRFSHDGPRQLGTGGALMRALPMLSDSFLVTYGDSYLLCDYQAVYAHFEHDERALGLMTVFENDNQFDTSNVIFRDGRIVRYDKRVRVPEMKHIDWGLSVLTQRAFDGFARDEPLDLAVVFERLVERGALLGHEVRQRFYEIGSRAGLEELSRVMAAEQENLRPA